MSQSTTVSVSDINSFKIKALYWANHFKTVLLLDSNDYPHQNYQSKDWVLAVDAVEELSCNENAFEELKKFQTKCKEDIFGYFSYDLKNEIEKLQSRHGDHLHFPELYFFKPRYVFEINGDKVTVNRNYPETFEIIEVINKIQVQDTEPQNILLQQRTSKNKYLENIGAIKQQIIDGDFYELNYCNEFYSEGVAINPVDTFIRLNEKAKAPFSCFFKHNDNFLLCASPERFLKKVGEKLTVQPIKGTIKKGITTEENDKLKQQLANDVKERAENVMIVDLMRNDLAKSSKPGSVTVDELFGIYEFNTVNQMVSTISSQIKEGVHFVDAIKNAFPMGSMTGAPKIEVMKNIEAYEDFKRGLYSGAIGYITPSGDFDFNVVIRSIFYNAIQKYLSIKAGGAITFDSVAEKEYDEVLLKAKSMMDVLNATIQ